MLRRRKWYVIYPQYFDATLSRSEGRRIPLELADPSPHILKLVKACDKLGLTHQIEKDKSYPSQWFKNSGRLLISIDKRNKIPKQSLIKEIAPIARRFVTKKKVPKKISKSSKDSKVAKKIVTRTASAKRKRKQ